MSIDKFGRHIHKHVVKKHLTSHHNMKIFLSQRIAKEIIRNYIKEIITSEKLIVGRTKQKKVLTLFSDGKINKSNLAYYLTNKANVDRYINKYYSGEIIDVRSYSKKSVALSIIIDNRVYSRTEAGKTPYLLKAGSTIIIKYTGPRPVPDDTNLPFAVEFLIEEDVSSEKNSI